VLLYSLSPPWERVRVRGMQTKELKNLIQSYLKANQKKFLAQPREIGYHDGGNFSRT
jgi:hypothetical protein